MTYNTPDGPRLAEGTASLATSGNAFVTWQYNGFEDKMRYESYFVRFDVESSNEMICDETLVAYPNPTSGVVYLSDGLSEVRLYDVAGREVYSASDVVNTIDLTQVAKGVYMLIAFDGEKYISTKIIRN